MDSGERMLRVTVELVPFGNECLKKTIGVAHIANIGLHLTSDDGSALCNYYVVEMVESGQVKYKVDGVMRYTNVFRFLDDLFAHRKEKV